MQTLTLCEGLTRLHSQPCSPKKPLKTPNFSPSPSPSPTFRPSQKDQKPSRRNLSFFLPRSLGQWPAYENIDEQLLRHIRRTSPSKAHDNESRFLGNKGSKTILDLEETKRDYHLMAKTLEDRNLTNENHTSGSLKHERVPLSDIYRGLKFTLLFGLLTFQSSQQAVAGIDFAGGMQPITYIGDLGDISTGFASAFLLIFFSELGDKTFFIAALLAARNSGAVVFIGTYGALAAMTIVSVILGRTFHYVDGILPFRFGETDLPIDDIAAVCLLVYFGVSTLREAVSGDGLKIKEEQEEAELAVSELSGNGAGIMAAANTVISTFLLVFVAEWGDKSFFSTIALAAASSPLGVVGGALAGHAVATLLAVVGGSLLGTFFSEKVIAYIGGTLFLVFALVTLIEIVS